MIIGGNSRSSEVIEIDVYASTARERVPFKLRSVS